MHDDGVASSDTITTLQEATGEHSHDLYQMYNPEITRHVPGIIMHDLRADPRLMEDAVHLSLRRYAPMHLDAVAAGCRSRGQPRRLATREDGACQVERRSGDAR
jgi:hypothetical protein